MAVGCECWSNEDVYVMWLRGVGGCRLTPISAVCWVMNSRRAWQAAAVDPVQLGEKQKVSGLFYGNGTKLLSSCVSTASLRSEN